MWSSPEPAGFDCVVTHHLNAFGSGVSRFNEIMAEGLGVEVVWLFDPKLLAKRRPLLSFKVGEMNDDERAALDAILDAAEWESGLFLHDWHDTPLERKLTRHATRVYC